MNLSFCIPVSSSVVQNAQTGGTANANVLTRNTFTGPVTINNTGGHGTVTVTVLTETHCLLAVSEIMLSDREPCSC